MPKYEVEGSPSDGYRIWLTTDDGDVTEQESPPFHAPCEAWWWGFVRGIDSEIVGFKLGFENTCPDCNRYAEMLAAKAFAAEMTQENIQIRAYMDHPNSVQHEVKWNGAKHSRIKTKARGHAAHRKGKRKAQRAARKGK